MEKAGGQFFRFESIYRRFETDKKYLHESGQVEPGQILTVTGPSGSGKSTLLKILARLLKAQSGEVFWHGRNWRSFSPPEWRRRIQFVSQKPVIFPGLIKDNFSLPFTLKNHKEKAGLSMAQAIDYMERAGLSASMLDQEAKSMSGGEAARVALVRALLIEPELLLLDEPTAFLDHDSRVMTIALINEWVKQKQRGIIVVSHQQDDLQYLDCQTVLSIPVRKAQ